LRWTIKSQKNLSHPFPNAALIFLNISPIADWPAAISLDPMRGLYNAMNRRTIEGNPPDAWIPKQRLTMEQALRGYTSAGAYASFEENTKDQLAPGMWADIIVFSQDLFQIPTMDIYKTRVVLTIFDGKVLYRQ
jgi:predicted amidohydrolase YtcJ